MVVGMYRTIEQKVVSNPRTVEEFEAMMKESVKQSKNYVSPFVKKKPSDAKEVIIHDPKKNPFAPLYRPDKEVIFYIKDKYHIAEPPRYLGAKEEKPKVLLVAAGAGGVPPSNNGGDKSSFIKDLTKFEKYKNVKNTFEQDSSMYNKNIKK